MTGTFTFRLPLLFLFVSLFTHLEAKKAPALRDFEIRLDDSEDWEIRDNMRFSQVTGYPLALYHLDFKTSEGTPEQRAMEYIKAHEELLGLRAGEAEQLKLHYIRESDAGTTVRYRQMVQGLPVGRSEITVNMDNQHVVRLVMNGFRQNINLPTLNPIITPQYARNIALQRIGMRGEIRYFKNNLMVFWNKSFTKLCYEVTVVGHDPHGDWQIVVDAMTGELVKVADVTHYHKPKEEGEEKKTHSCSGNHNHSNNYFFATGTGPVFDADPLSSAGVAYGGNYVDNNDASNASLQAEVFNYSMLDITFTGSQYELNGPYAVIWEWEAPNKGSFSQATNTWVFNRSDDGFEATNTYYHLDWSMRYLNVTLGCNIMPRQYAGGVRFDPHSLNGADNSHFSSATGELCFGEGCVDDAEDSDVIHHELGHGLHDWVTNGGLSQTEGLSEGSGDYWAGSYNRSLNQWTSSDPQYYYMFNWDGHNTCWNGRQLNVFGYPGALTGGIHADGQLWASCLMTIWDVVGQQDLDKAFWEGLGMTNSSTNQNDAAVAVYNAAINMGYTSSDIIAIHDGFTACGYTMPPLPFATVSFTSTTSNVDEGDGCSTKTAQATIVLDQDPGGTVTVTVTAAGTATTDDASITSGSTLTFDSGNWSTPQPIVVTINADAVVEGDETVELTISSVTGGNAVIGAEGIHTMTLADDDFAPTGLITMTLLSDPIADLSNWTIIDGSNDTYTWELSNGYGGNGANTLDGSSFLLMDCDAAPNNSSQDEIAESAAFNTVGLSNLTLNFDQFYEANNGDVITVDVWDGAAWQNVYTRNSGNGSIGGWNAPNQQSIDITAHSNAGLKVRFHYVGNRDNWWAVDNISISGETTIAVQTVVNSGNPDAQWLGPNQTVHFYDPITMDVMCTIENLTAHDYGCTDVYVENGGSSFMQVADYALASEQFFDKTFRVVPTNNNASGSYNITFYLTDAERLGWEAGGTRSWTSAQIVKTAGSITAMTAATPYEQLVTSLGTLNTDYSITGTFNTGFSGFGFAQSLNPVPVELTEITADAMSSSIRIKWSTAAEINNEGFELQRSQSPTQGFEAIAWIEGQGNSAEANEYYYDDEDVKEGIVYYYRLKQLDFDGAFSFSPTVDAILETTRIITTMYPNPAESTIFVDVVKGSGETIGYKVLDAAGKLLLNEIWDSENQLISIDISSWPKGVYIIQVESGGDSEVMKFVKE